MSEFATVVMALSAAVGAWAARPLPLAGTAVVVALGMALRRPAVLCLGVALAASSLGARSWAGLHPPGTGPWSGTVTLVGDPSRSFGAVRVTVRIGGKRVDAWARGRSGADLADRAAGERVRLAGRLEALSPTVRRSLAYRHLAARLTVDRVGGWAPGHAAARLANGIRRTLVAGTSSMPADQRALFAGFVLGDDRDQPVEVADDFRASGLTHLLVVSGENVAFVLGLFAPLSRRLGLRGRLVAGVAVLVLFGMVTRWEPSVIRAEAMAGLGLVAGTLGRPASGLRLLALAVAGLLLVDPLLVHSLGFLLSVGACAGIALLAARITAAIPGPRPLASALGVSLAAQAGVAPLLVPAFGAVPLATIPANLLAVPAAGPLTAWGMAAGLPAGVVGGRCAHLLHLPTGILLAWVAAVARHAAAAPLGRVGTVQLVALATALAVAALVARQRPRGGRWWTVAAVVGVAATAVLPARFPGPLDGQEVTAGVRLWRRGTVTVMVVDGARSARDVLDGLHRAEVRGLDVVVVARPGRGPEGVMVPVLRRFTPGLLMAPSGSTLPGARAPVAGTVVTAGIFAVTVVADSPRLDVTVAAAGSQAAARAPPL